MEIKGRHASVRPVKPQYIGQIRPDGLLRIDDAANPEFWLEVELKESDFAMLALGREYLKKPTGLDELYKLWQDYGADTIIPRLSTVECCQIFKLLHRLEISLENMSYYNFLLFVHDRILKYCPVTYHKAMALVVLGMQF